MERKTTIIVFAKYQQLHIIRIALLVDVFVSSANEVLAQQLSTPFPQSFRNTRVNELAGEANLAPVFKKIKEGKPVKIMQIGDSHVRGNILPRTVESTLKSVYSNIDFAYYGINGAWAHRFYENDMINRVLAEHPDLVIISFGTNEAHGNKIDERAHGETMRLLTQRISDRCPNACFLFTTPPGSFIAQRTATYTTVRGRRRMRYTTTRVPNQNTANVAHSIVNFCASNQMAVWDIFTIAGGSTSAFTNWRNAGLMNYDCVHYLASGYTLQGKLLAEAIYKAYLRTPITGRQTRMMHSDTPKQQVPYKTVKGF